MKDVYLRAAKYIDNNDDYYSCCAVSRANRFCEFDNPTIKNYENLFSEIEDGNFAFWARGWDDDSEEIASQRRVLALLFMHWITVSEGKNK